MNISRHTPPIKKQNLEIMYENLFCRRTEWELHMCKNKLKRKKFFKSYLKSYRFIRNNVLQINGMRKCVISYVKVEAAYVEQW